MKEKKEIFPIRIVKNNHLISTMKKLRYKINLIMFILEWNFPQEKENKMKSKVYALSLKISQWQKIPINL